ncbi:methyltransferase domain-containing protein [Nocardia otitidiscaviarum]|uniref:methyltransferase domain-containing protein n=1 Tax=Nocardia otitidiscaviarum TaxID=1823 RepID=UPI0004A6CF03|nr:methyltransferase domain-containing protein [Nocardia otitidiscaviarum]MBF6134599.1 methyltransferase domain-containing protein [Nocardia otitidiscaviarum]MBF6485775.1 methyltransferase domain-containing protein [Nocardia otitidiscaviarum]
MNSLAGRLMSIVAGQLGHPSGPLGKVVALMLNRGNRAAVAAAVDAAEVAAGEVAADIGFGGGVGLPLLLERAGADGVVYGVEISTDMLTRAKSRHTAEIGAGRLRLLAGSLDDLPFDADSLDAAITVNTLYFVADLDRACAELARVLRPKGRLVIGVGDPDAMAKMPFTPYGFRLRPVADIQAALGRAGFDVEDEPLPGGPVPFHLLVARQHV